MCIVCMYVLLNQVRAGNRPAVLLTDPAFMQSEVQYGYSKCAGTLIYQSEIISACVEMTWLCKTSLHCD